MDNYKPGDAVILHDGREDSQCATVSRVIERDGENVYVLSVEVKAWEWEVSAAQATPPADEGAEASTEQEERDALKAEVVRLRETISDQEHSRLQMIAERDALAAQVATARETMTLLRRVAAEKADTCFNCDSIWTALRDALATLGGEPGE